KWHVKLLMCASTGLIFVSQVSCPGVHLPAKDDLYLSMCFLGQYRQSEAIPAVFPLLFYEKMTFEKIYRHALDPGDITVMLECKLYLNMQNPFRYSII
uniref:Spermatogenesis-associated protein 6 N-terminal domain-containing protein n=1 Tax=Mastacembelus armatus TaxID=205130 RepID=A0A3Q3L1E4_9TELE